MNDWTDPDERPPQDVARAHLPRIMQTMAGITDSLDALTAQMRMLGLKTSGALAAIVGHSIVPEQPVTFSLQITLPNGYWKRLERAIDLVQLANPAMGQDDACNDIFEAGISAIIGDVDFEITPLETEDCHVAK